MNKLEQIVTSAEPEARKILEEFVHTFADTIKENNPLKQKIDYIAHDNRLLRKRFFGSSSEKLATEEPAIQDDLNLFNDTIKRIRQQQSKPILDDLKKYLDEKSPSVLHSSKLGTAIEYTRKRWPYLLTYLQDGRYEIDNNHSERAIKPFVCGRKNWLFSNSVDGTLASANLFSLIESAKLHDLDPVKYLTYVFKEPPNCKVLAAYEALLPYAVRDEKLKISR